MLLVAVAATLFWWQPWRRTPASPEQRLISTFPGSHRGASFSPDSKQIAFINAVDGVPQVWIKNLDQGEPVQITFGNDPANRPRWSPTGDRIVYVRRSQGTSGIWSVSPEGGTPQKVIENGRNPNWSWDGKRLVFERESDIWTTNADGTNQRRVEGAPPTDLSLADRMPAFSPDGSLIAFFQTDRGPMGDYWIMRSAGGEARRLTFDRAFGGAPAWTPDGRFIVFPSMRAGSMTLWKMPASSGQPEPVLVSAGEDTEPEISRDGRKLIYTNARNRFILTITNPATGETKDLIEWRANIVDPSFSPQEGSLLFFGLTSEGDVHLFTINADGDNLKQVTRGKDEENIHPQWSEDGSAIYFYQANPTRSFRKISVNGGESIELVSGWEWGTHNHARVDPEGKKIVYSKLDRNSPVATMIRDIESGREAAFTALLHLQRWSPNGRFIIGADFSSSRWPLGDIKICPADGGPCRVMAKGYFPRWSQDGMRIYFLRVISGGREVWSVSSDGTDEKKIMVMMPIEPNGTFFDVAADGRIVWVKYIEGKSELWFSDFAGSQ
jgi:Tol biopolymer transport system component